MDISFKNSSLEKTFSEEKRLRKKYGAENTKYIIRRISILRASENLQKVPHTKPTRRHELEGNRKGKFAVDLKHPYRLVFEPNHKPLPKKDDGGLDLGKITAIKILEVEDYH